MVVCVDTKFRRVSELISSNQVGNAEKLLLSGVSHDFYHAQSNFSWEELAGHFRKAGLDVVEVVGAPVFMHQVDPKTLKKLESSPKTRARLLEIELAHCTDRSLANFAGHLQIVGKKR